MITMMKRIINFSGKYKPRIYAAFVCSFIKSMLFRAPIMFSFFVLTEFYQGTASADMCKWVGLAMIACVALQILFQHLDNKLQTTAGVLTMADKRMELGTHLRKLPMGYFTEGNIGKISSVLSSDMTFVEENCMAVLADLMSYIFAQAIMVLFLAILNIWLGLAAIGIILVAMLFGRGMKKEALHDSIVKQEQNENLTEAVLDFVEGIGIAKTYNLLGEKSKELSDNFTETCRTSLEFEVNHTPWQRWLNIVFGVGSAVLISIAMLLYSTDMLAVTFVCGIMLMVFECFAPLKSLYGQSARLTVMNSCLDRIEQVFDEAVLPDEGTEIIPPVGDGPEIEFQNVTFGYGDKEVLNNISFQLEKNKMLALVGPSGSGKSTVANLLARFWDVNSGKVLVRGKDIRQVKLKDLMEQISMVFQHVYLFQDTIAGNISLGRPDANEEEIIEAAKKARCYDFIMALPDGFQTVVGEGGHTLSGGERQRISIARCILKDAPIVILDEATASVDIDNESYIQQAISELCRGKTLLVIAHRLGTIRNADTILVISEGEIAQRGSHDTLIKNEGIYREFVTLRENSRGWSRRRATH